MINLICTIRTVEPCNGKFKQWQAVFNVVMKRPITVLWLRNPPRCQLGAVCFLLLPILSITTACCVAPVQSRRMTGTRAHPVFRYSKCLRPCDATSFLKGHYNMAYCNYTFLQAVFLEVQESREHAFKTQRQMITRREMFKGAYFKSIVSSFMVSEYKLRLFRRLKNRTTYHNRLW